MLKKWSMLLILCFVFASFGFTQGKDFDYKGLAWLGSELKDFTLPVYQGGEFKLSDYKGKKNLLLVFPRGFYSKTIWCDICIYQYLEWIDIELKDNIRKKYDMDIVFIMPYKKEIVTRWFNEMLDNYKKYIYSYLVMKNPDEKVKSWVNYVKKHYNRDFSKWTPKTLPKPFKVLIDGDRKLTKRLDIFRTAWERTEMEQCVPMTLLLNKEGVVVYKHRGQYTLDRPSAKYLMTIMDTFLNK